ncbi:hypothetical protein PN498_15150 [Oscillatoria sp. CS-180]|uniref:hypothetical protein n=1 Tax=Oscillatoria sp. CS-180 TaxID=3021720 RepID=UPI0023300046|nr:hypothetical protein [Oscillatoria sp. CS-180]MDB9527336.1 hypothetical protein [Oscillatoria sp. CS-180]
MHSSFQSLLESVCEAETIGEARDKLGEILKLKGPATRAVTLRVLADSAFAERLISVRNFPDWRDRLLDDPVNLAFEPTDQSLGEGEGDTHSVTSTVSVIKKSSAALLQWGAAGFQKTKPEIAERRKAACLSCDQLTEPPNSFPYQIARAFADSDRRICAACGCVVSKKILMATERCPLVDPENPNRSRWGDATT